jgi:hypothetical protein
MIDKIYIKILIILESILSNLMFKSISWRTKVIDLICKIKLRNIAA